MKKIIRISIPEPCHEDWAKMTPTEKGKFCKVCTKEVFDFTQTTDEELVKRVMQGKKLCGRFKKSQLNREVKLERKSGINLLPYAASLLMPLSVLATSTSKNNASNIEKPYISLGIGSNPVEKAVIFISGYVTDDQGRPIKNAKVTVLENNSYVFTNNKGFYKIHSSSNGVLLFQKGALQSKQIQLGTKSQEINITLSTIEKTPPILVGKIAPIKVQEIEQKQDSTKITIKGTVTDEMNLPLPGVNVIVKGTTNYTQTDFDGNYSIEAEANQTLVFSYLSYETEQILVSNISNTINLTMKPDDTVLGGEIVFVTGGISISDQVVVNPYQSNNYFDDEQRKRRKERRAYAEKENAFKKVKAAREKAARLLKRNNKKNK